jgi:hypothetical protein
MATYTVMNSSVSTQLSSLSLLVKSRHPSSMSTRSNNDLGLRASVMDDEDKV